MDAGFKLAPEQWATLRRLLDEALDLPADQRDAWLERLAPQHAAYRPRLRSLLANALDGGAARHLHTLPKVETDHFAPRPPGAKAEAQGEFIGPYRLLHELGSGGMASVWLAERTDMLQGRQVALKLPHGAWKRAGLAERLQREREILATLNHPNIATLYDAGVADDGQPYLALEHVEGERIDAYCRRLDLDLPARLRLFLQVARAVAHAHAQLVVHRDLKPSNILVTTAGEVKLLDFGIAKLLEHGVAQETELTQQGGRALTPEYAAPEQFTGGPVATAADVYSLGVLLFELLANARPYAVERASRAAVEEAVRRADVPRPSSVAPAAWRRALRGDLDTIVAKAMQPEPARRYATVDAMADDVLRHLERRPVLAQPDSAWYRAGKLVRRHTVALSATAAVATAMLVGSGVALWQAHQARTEQHRAEAVKDFVASIFRDADPFNSASGPTAAAVLRQAEARLTGQFAKDPLLRGELLTTLAGGFIGVGDFEAAERLLSEAITLATRTLGPTHVQTLRARVTMTTVHRFRGRIPQMQAELDSVWQDMQSVPDVAPEDRRLALDNQAHLAIEQGRYADALAAAQESLGLARKHHGEGDVSHVNAALLVAVASAYLRDHNRTLEASEQALRLAQGLYGRDRPHARVLDARGVHGRALGNLGRYAEAADELAEVVAQTEQLLGAQAPMVGYLSADVGRFRLEVGALDSALEYTRRARELLAKSNPPDSFTMAAAHMHVGRAELAMRRLDVALTTLLEARRAMRLSRGVDAPLSLDLTAHVAVALAWLGRVDDAEREIGPVIDRYRAADGQFKFRGLHYAGVVRRLAGRFDEAVALQQAALAALDDHAMHDRRREAARKELVLAMLGQGRAHETWQAVKEWPRFERLDVPTTPDDAERLAALGRMHLDLRQPAQASRALVLAHEFWARVDPHGRAARDARQWSSRALGAADAASARAPTATHTPYK